MAALRAIRARSGSVDIIVCEHSLPDTDALALVEELRQRGWSQGAISAVAFIVSKSLNANEILRRASSESQRDGSEVVGARELALNRRHPVR